MSGGRSGTETLPEDDKTSISEQTSDMDAPGLGWSKKRSLFQAMLVDGQDAAELGGEDPLRPLFRELLEHSKAGLTYVNWFLEAVGGAVKLQEP